MGPHDDEVGFVVPGIREDDRGGREAPAVRTYDMNLGTLKEFLGLLERVVRQERVGLVQDDCVNHVEFSVETLGALDS